MLSRYLPHTAATPANVVEILLQTVTAEWKLEERAALICVEKALDTLRLEGARQRSETQTRTPITGGLTPVQVRTICNYVRDRIHLPIRLRELVCLARLSRSQLQRLFKVSFGCSPHQYIARTRVAVAQELMATSDRCLSDIALCCGFSDQSHFNRVHLQITGKTPGDWRRGFRANLPAEGISSDAN